MPPDAEVRSARPSKLSWALTIAHGALLISPKSLIRTPRAAALTAAGGEEAWGWVEVSCKRAALTTRLPTMLPTEPAEKVIVLMFTLAPV